jgi:hypothetical protein
MTQTMDAHVNKRIKKKRKQTTKKKELLFTAGGNVN